MKSRMFYDAISHPLLWVSYDRNKGGEKMRDLIIKYSQAGESCSHIILLAAADKYNLTLSEDMMNSCRAIRAGFGIGGICSGLIAGVMVLGMLFDEEEARQKSLQLFCMFQGTYQCMDCGRLAVNREDCEDVLVEIGERLEEIVAQG